MVPRVRALVDSLVGERARLERFARSLTEEELTRAVPGSSWTVKDFIAHLSMLDAAYIGWFVSLAGDPGHGNHRGSPGFDLDRFNESATINRSGDRKRLPVSLPPVQFLPGWTSHDAIHVADMLKALPERRNNPEIVAWLGDPDVTASIGSHQKAMG